jgi:hypothetical protein
MRKPLGDAVVYKFVTIKTRQPVVSAEPEKATWIRNDLVHAITRQSVSRSVSSNRKLFSALLRAGDENEYEDDDRSLHSADIITSDLRVGHQQFTSRIKDLQTKRQEREYPGIPPAALFLGWGENCPGRLCQNATTTPLAPVCLEREFPYNIPSNIFRC